MTRPTVRLLLTRPRAASERFLTSLPSRTRDAVVPVISPLIEIEPLVSSIDTGDARGLIFTSANGVETAARIVAARDLPCFCVGEATTARAIGAGWDARCCGQDADQLVAGLLRSRPAGPLLHLRGRHARGDIDQRLTAAGLITRALPIYDQIVLALSSAAEAAMQDTAPVVVPLFSPRTARHFADFWQAGPPLLLVALSAAVADEVKHMNYKELTICEQPDAAWMAKNVAGSVAKAIRLEAGQGGR